MAVTKVEYGEDLMAVASRVYGHGSGAIMLLQDNDLTGLTATLTEGQVLVIREGVFIKLTEVESVFRQRNLPDYELLNKQSFFDVLIENQADMSGVFELMESNNMDGITEHIFTGDMLKILNTAFQPRIRERIRSFMPVATIEESDKSDGIGFMFIEKNFIVR